MALSSDLVTMPPILSAGAMRAAEARMIAQGVASLDLMERAGAVTAVAVLAFGLPRAVNVLCGVGNNGGDGYVLARHLADAGHDVTVTAARAPRGADAAVMAARWTGRVVGYGAAVPVAGFVDALFGIGVDRALGDGDVAELLRLGGGAQRRVAIDLPSGVGCDDGALLGAPLKFGLTVTFGARKLAHVLEPARSLCGRVVVADIGLDAVPSAVRLNARPTLLAADTRVHKFARGSVIVVGGPAGAGGAARLASRAALRIGAGVVTLACSADAMCENAARLDAVMLRSISDADALAVLLEDPRIGAVVAGPGLGIDARALLDAVLASDVAAVIDGEAFTVFAGRPEALGRAAVLTPHEGEFVRLFGDLPGNRVDRALAGSARAGCVVVLKGPDTVIAAPDGRAVVNNHASPALATAGSGDVLAGIIAGLIAQGMPAFDAACAGAWAHGDAGLRGGIGLIAEDLPELLPQVLAGLA